MSCIEKLPHAECGSSDALQVFEEGGVYTGFCFACDTYIPDPYSNKPKGYKPAILARSQADIQEELGFIFSSLPTIAYKERLLEQQSLAHFGIKTAVSEVDGVSPTVYYFPYNKGKELIAYKARLVADKRMWGVGSLKDVDLFGWQQALNTGARKLFITEGEFDAVALWQSLVAKQKGTAWETYLPAVVSLPSGSNSASRSIVGHLNDIQSMFQEVVLVFDMDEQGQKACQEVTKILPKAVVATLPSKDANQCLIDGRKNALVNAVLFKTTAHKNSRLVNLYDIWDEACKPVEWGLSWPWKQLTDATRGIRFGETYYIGAGVKMGKSEVVNAIASHLVLEHGLKVLLAKPEEANRKTVRMIAGKAVGKIFHDPKIPFDPVAFNKAKELVNKRILALDIYQHLGWQTLRQDIVSAVEQGCKAVFIDPITNLVNGIDAANTNTVLQSIAQDLAAMAKDFDIVVFIFCHLKAPETGPPHERGGKVQSFQFSGSRAMMRSCNYMIGIEGDKDPDKPIEERNIRKIVMLEDREFGTSGYFRLYWDERTGLFNELEEHHD